MQNKNRKWLCTEGRTSVSRVLLFGNVCPLRQQLHLLVNVEMVSRTDKRTSLEEPGLRGAWRTSRGPDTTEEVPNSPHQALRSRKGDHTVGSCRSCGYHRFPVADWPASGQRQCNLQAGQLNNDNFTICHTNCHITQTAVGVTKNPKRPSKTSQGHPKQHTTNWQHNSTDWDIIRQTSWATFSQFFFVGQNTRHECWGTTSSTRPATWSTS